MAYLHFELHSKDTNNKKKKRMIRKPMNKYQPQFIAAALIVYEKHNVG